MCVSILYTLYIFCNACICASGVCSVYYYEIECGDEFFDMGYTFVSNKKSALLIVFNALK